MPNPLEKEETTSIAPEKLANIKIERGSGSEIIERSAENIKRAERELEELKMLHQRLLGGELTEEEKGFIEFIQTLNEKYPNAIEVHLDKKNRPYATCSLKGFKAYNFSENQIDGTFILFTKDGVFSVYANPIIPNPEDMEKFIGVTDLNEVINVTALNDALESGKKEPPAGNYYGLVDFSPKIISCMRKEKYNYSIFASKRSLEAVESLDNLKRELNKIEESRKPTETSTSSYKSLASQL